MTDDAASVAGLPVADGAAMTAGLAGWLAPVRSPEAFDRLAAWRLRRTGSRFRFLRDTVLSQAPELARRSGFAASCDALSALPMRSVAPALSYPGFERWLHRGLDLIGRRAHVKLPHGSTLTHLAALATFVLGMAETRLPVWVDRHGRVPLRGAGRVLQFPLAAAGTQVWLRGAAPDPAPAAATQAPQALAAAEHGLQPVVAAGHGPQLVSAEAGAQALVVELPRTAEGWELNAVDPLLSRHAVPAPDDEVITPAWELVRLVLPDHADELRRCMRVVVPVGGDRSGDPPGEPACLGLWEPPVPADAPTLGHAMVVPAAEAKLGLVLGHALDESGPVPDRPRLERALLDAVRADASRAYWRACADALTGPPGEAARQQATAAERDCAAARDALRELEPLPSAVRELAESVCAADGPPATRRVAAAPNRGNGAIPEADARRVERFVAAWLAAGGTSRERPVAPAVLPAGGLGEVAELLGIGAGVRVNLAYSGTDRTDGSLDRLGLACVREPGLADRVRELLAGRQPAGDPVEQTVRGHLAYVSGDMPAAARHYAAAARAVPDNLDCWHDLAFALLHLGRPESRVFRFAPDLLVYAVSAVSAEPTVAAEVGGPPVEDGDLGWALAMIRAVDRATGLGLI